MKRAYVFSLKLVIAFFGIAQISWGQNKLSGVVISDATSTPLSNAIIKISHTNAGTVSDSLGRFSLPVSTFPVLLEVTHIGHEDVFQEVRNLPSGLLEIRLRETIRQLTEVVVSTGYQQIPRERVTGSFGLVNNELFNRRVSADVLSRLEDVVPGLIFNRRMGANNISIRGRNTISGDGQPLIVVDNFPFEGDLSSLNPNDIENVSLLRDAAASSIWGARAGNGVIVITTKKGSYQKSPKVTFNTNITLYDTPNIRYQPQMSSSDYIDWEQYLFENGYYNSFENSSNKVAFTPVVELLIKRRDGLLPADEVAGQILAMKNNDIREDIERYLYRSGQSQQYSLALNGGDLVQKYAVSLGFDSNKSSAVGDDNERLTLNATHAYRLLNKRFELITGISYVSQAQQRNSLGGLTYTGTNGVEPLYPYARLEDNEGNALILEKNHRLSYAKSALENGLLDWTYNPIEEMRISDKSTGRREIRLRTGLNYKVTTGIQVEMAYLYQNSNTLLRNYYSEETYYARNLINTYTQIKSDGSRTYPIPQGGILDRTYNTLNGHTFRGQLNLSEKVYRGDLDAIAGVELRNHHIEGADARWYGYNDTYATSRAVDYSSGFISYVNPGGVSIKIPSAAEQSYLIDRYLSYYTNGAYSLKKKYSISASARLDQSNLFGVKTNQKGVPLWSAGLSWVASAEDFMKFAPWSYLKLRITYGSSGNVNKSLSAQTTAAFSATDNLSLLPYATIQNPPNPSLQWEKVKMLNIGVDFEIMNGRINGSFEYYWKRGLNLFGQVPYAPSTGVSIFSGNTSSTRGNGLDMNLQVKLIEKKPALWDMNVLLSYVTDKVTDFKVEYPASYFLVSGEAGGYALKGKPQYALYSYEFGGLDSQNGDPLGYLEGSPSNQWSKIIQSATVDNLHYHGSARPTVYGAWRNNLCWKGWTLSANISYRLGYYFRRSSVNYAALWRASPVHADYENRWKQPGDEQYSNIPSNPAAYNPDRNLFYMNSSILVEKGDHIRWQDIQLAYTLFHKSKKEAKMPGIELYAYANNLGVIWKASKVNIDPDYPLATFPPVRTISAGLKLIL